MNKKRCSTDNEPAYAVVYSTDPTPPKKLESNIAATPYSLRPAVRIEKKGRGGKSVTVLFKLPAHETLLKALTSHLKKTLGSGGTSYIKNGEGFVEIQGEHTASILDITRGFKWP